MEKHAQFLKRKELKVSADRSAVLVENQRKKWPNRISLSLYVIYISKYYCVSLSWPD